jgi:hypothetical protein
MKLQLLPEGSTDCPLIRIFDFDCTEATVLVRGLQSLISASIDSVSLHELPVVSAYNGFELTAILDERPRNVATEYAVIAGKSTNSYIWRGTTDEWKDVCELLVPMTVSTDPHSYAWLTDDLGVQVLASPSGSW